MIDGVAKNSFCCYRISNSFIVFIRTDFLEFFNFINLNLTKDRHDSTPPGAGSHITFTSSMLFITSVIKDILHEIALFKHFKLVIAFGVVLEEHFEESLLAFAFSFFEFFSRHFQSPQRRPDVGHRAIQA